MRKGRIRTGDWEVHQRELNKPEVKNLRNLSKESELININMFQVCITKLKNPKTSVLYLCISESTVQKIMKFTDNNINGQQKSGRWK